jgi:hypothetical protein
MDTLVKLFTKSNRNTELDVHESVHYNIITKATNKMQICMLIYYSLSVLRVHVSGDVFAHHQEHLTVFTASGKYYQMLQIQSSAPDDGRKHRPKHVELTRNNKLTYIVASCWLFS